VRADGILLMPGDQDRLVTHLVDLADGNRRGTTIGVIGGCGGVGATVTAAALALTAARTGRSTLLVDADPHGGGIDLVLGCEDSVGVRWPEVAATNGRVSAAAFRAALPATGSLRVLSWDRTAPRQPSPDVMRTMLEAAQRGSELVLVDLPRAWDEAAVQALLLTDTVLLVTCPDVRGVAAAGCLLTGLRDVCSDVRLLVRGARGADLDSHEVADSLGIPLAGRVPTQRGLPRALDEGLGPLARGSLERTCRRLLDHVLEPGEAVP
jgi:secretion/DNA translocation related CpaE-like protein